MKVKELIELLVDGVRKDETLNDQDVTVRLEDYHDTDRDEDTFIPVSEVKTGDDAEVGGVVLVLEARLIASINAVPKPEYIASYDTDDTSPSITDQEFAAETLGGTEYPEPSEPSEK